MIIVYIFVWLSRCGRSECIDDLWISGDAKLLISKIKCSEEAKKEAERLAAEAILAIDSSFFSTSLHNYTFITFLNARSLRKHQTDIMNDPELMKSSILGIGETHLNSDEEILFDSFKSHFVNAGKGKGVAAFTRLNRFPLNVTKILQETFSAIVLEFVGIRIIFAYMSNKTNMDEVKNRFGPILEMKKATIIMGDMNFHFPNENPMKSYFKDLGFHQVIDRVTHDEGHILDHIYTLGMPISKENVFLKSLYFSDHDALCIKFENFHMMI